MHSKKMLIDVTSDAYSEHKEMVTLLETISQTCRDKTSCEITCESFDIGAMEDKIKCTDCLIVDRNPLTVRMVELAYRYNKPIIFATDIPMFGVK